METCYYHYHLEKKSKSKCSNSHRISLCSVAGKNLVHSMLCCLLVCLTNTILPETCKNSGLGKSTLDMIFIARLLLEKSREQQLQISIAFVNLTKAFDRVKRPALEVIEKFWLFINIPEFPKVIS